MDIRIFLLEHFGIVSSGLCGRIHNKEGGWMFLPALFRTVAAKCFRQV